MDHSIEDVVDIPSWEKAISASESVFELEEVALFGSEVLWAKNILFFWKKIPQEELDDIQRELPRIYELIDIRRGELTNSFDPSCEPKRLNLSKLVNNALREYQNVYVNMCFSWISKLRKAPGLNTRYYRACRYFLSRTRNAAKLISELEAIYLSNKICSGKDKRAFRVWMQLIKRGKGPIAKRKWPLDEEDNRIVESEMNRILPGSIAMIDRCGHLLSWYAPGGENITLADRAWFYRCTDELLDTFGEKPIALWVLSHRFLLDSVPVKKIRNRFHKKAVTARFTTDDGMSSLDPFVIWPPIIPFTS